MKIQIKKTIRTLLTVILIAAITITTSAPACAKTSSKISLSLNGRRAIIMDMDTGEVLYSKNAKTKCHNASTTKLMTAVVAVEKNKSLNKKVTISGKAAGADGVSLSLGRGSRYSMKDLLHGMLLPSANDCAIAVAEGTSGSVDKFMKEVNKKVKKLGCKNTHFDTPNGLRSGNPHYTTAYDLALIMRYAYQNDTIRKILQKKSYSFQSTGGRRHSVKSTNYLLGSRDYYCVGKTGSGWTAKYCFTGVYTYKGHSYVIVTLGSAGDGQRFSDARKMISACRKDAKEVRKKLSLEKSSLEVKVGETVKAKVKGTKAAAQWSSKNEDIASVDEDGIITGIQTGSTTIYAKIYGNTLKCKVRVVD
ncbi:MAG: serine hydrolase [Lachnospiraceae bacterium]|nr:serine hydrolase [Lachnospiraceae bacterium]